LGRWDWVDLVAEYDRGVEFQDVMHYALDRLAAVLGVGLGALLNDRVDTDAFWIAPQHSPVVAMRVAVGTPELSQTFSTALPRAEVQQWLEQVSRVPPRLLNALAEPLRLLAASRATEPGWLRFTLGWAALERLATEHGRQFDPLIEVQQPRCSSCGTELPRRKPGARARLEALMRALQMPEFDAMRAELRRINDLRGQSHGGAIPNGRDVLAPEQLANTIVRAIIEHPERVSA
jgi:hypothetical protein